MAPSKLTILITGSAGILGRRLTPILADSHQVIALIHRDELQLSQPAALDVKRCDLTDADATAQLVDEADPDVVVNCAAMTDVDGCEENVGLADRVNSGIVKNILLAVSKEKTYFVQISTDYIFDGEAGPYPEGSKPNPINVYGKTKLDAETLVKSWGGRSLIVRTSALYDCHSTEKANLFASTYNRLQDGRQVVAASDLYCNPIWAVNLAEALDEVIEERTSGIINIAGPEYISRYRFSVTIAEHYGFRPNLVSGKPVAELKRRAPRPLRAGVDIARAISILRTDLLSPNEVFSSPGFKPD